MTSFTRDDILSMDKAFRTPFINGLSGFRSAVLVGTVNELGRPNLAVFSSTLHVGANPPLMGLLLRPAAAKQHTRDNIFTSRSFTINAIRSSFLSAAHQAAMRLPADESEFDRCGFTPRYWAGLAAPAVHESPLRIGLSLVEHHEVNCNQTTLIVGAIEQVDIATDLLDPDGHLRPDRADLVCCGDLETYYQPAFLERFA
jgi:flavin reductase (DIM6/NTAB) family NADH-FMN oxidoreductase RutF